MFSAAVIKTDKDCERQIMINRAFFPGSSDPQWGFSLEGLLALVL